LENEKIVQVVRENIHKLEEFLRNSGYSLDNFSFLPAGEPYTVVDTPQSIENPDFSGEIAHFDMSV
jgi:hypothetical protein